MVLLFGIPMQECIQHWPQDIATRIIPLVAGYCSNVSNSGHFLVISDDISHSDLRFNQLEEISTGDFANLQRLQRMYVMSECEGQPGIVFKF